MALMTKPAEESDGEEPHKLSKKELARQFRHEAYLRAKEYRKTDPRQIAMKEKMKELRRDAYEKAQERNKECWNGIKKASKEKSARKRIVKHDKLPRNMVVPASTIKGPAPEMEKGTKTEIPGKTDMQI